MTNEQVFRQYIMDLLDTEAWKTSLSDTLGYKYLEYLPTSDKTPKIERVTIFVKSYNTTEEVKHFTWTGFLKNKHLNVVKTYIEVNIYCDGTLLKYLQYVDQEFINKVIARLDIEDRLRIAKQDKARIAEIEHYKLLISNT